MLFRHFREELRRKTIIDYPQFLDMAQQEKEDKENNNNNNTSSDQNPLINDTNPDTNQSPTTRRNRSITVANSSGNNNAARGNRRRVYTFGSYVSSMANDLSESFAEGGAVLDNSIDKEDN